MLELDAVTVIVLVAVSLVAGAAGGLLGISGAVVTVPGMTLVNAAAPLSRAASLVVNVAIGLSGAIRHHQARCFLPRVFGLMLLGGLVGGGAGTLLARHLDRWTWVFPGVFAVFLAYVIVLNLRLLAERRWDTEVHFTSDAPYPLTPRRVGALLGVGFPMGLLAGLLGIGGGVLAVPLQQTLVDMPLRNAIACSSATIVGICAAAAFAAITLGAGGSTPVFAWWQPLVVSAVLIPGGVIGARVGAHFTHRLPLRTVRVAFVVVVTFGCFKMAQQSAQLYRKASQATATQEARPR